MLKQPSPRKTVLIVLAIMFLAAGLAYAYLAFYPVTIFMILPGGEVDVRFFRNPFSSTE